MTSPEGGSDLAGQRLSSVSPVRATRLSLGEWTYDIIDRALVMGILNRTPDSFYDRGETYALDDLLVRAEQLVDDGADVLDVGGVKAGPGPDVAEQEEMDRVVPAIEALHARFPIPLSVDTWRSSVAGEAYAAGAVLGNDISGFSDPAYVTVAAAAGASVVATHIRIGPRVPDPDPIYENVVDVVESFLIDRVGRARSAGLAPEQIVVDAGLDLGKTPGQSLDLLRASDRLCEIGCPLLLSASNKTFLGALLALDLTERGPASLSAGALGVELGCRIVRVHDVAGHHQVCNIMAALSAARRRQDGDRDDPTGRPVAAGRSRGDSAVGAAVEPTRGTGR